MAYSLGVDLGTTFLAAAVARPAGVGMVALGEQGVVAPAVVLVTDEGELLTGRAAQRRAAGRPDLLGRELKRRLADPAPIRLGGVDHPVTALLGAQLRDVVARVTDIEGAPPEHVVLGRPESWDRQRRERFDEVARAAGLPEHRTVADAAAAVSAALADRLHDGQIVAVYDLGGGAFEASVVRKRPDGHEVLGAAGIDALGGLDFDDAVLSHVDQATGGAVSDLDGDDPEAAAAIARLRQECALAKEILSVDTETVIPVTLPGWHTEVRLTRWAFEEMVRPAVVATTEALSRAVRSAGLISSDLGAVLLMGGSSRIPLVTEVLSQEFGRPTVSGVHPKYPVASGAAAAAAAPAPRAYAGTGAVGDEVAPTGPVTADPVTPGPVTVGAPTAAGAPHPAGRNGAVTYPDPHPLDAPTRMLVIPRAEPERLLPAFPPEPPPRRRFGHLSLAAAAAAVAVLVLVLVHLLAPGPPPAPPVVPAAPPVSSTVAPPPTTTVRSPTTTPSTRTRSGRTSTRSARPTTRRSGT